MGERSKIIGFGIVSGGYILTMTVKQHKNKNGEWTACHASKRACRYGGSDTHRVAPLNSTEAVKTSTGVIAPPAHPEPSVEDYSYDEQTLRWKVSPGDIPIVQKRIAALNARLEKAGAEEKFEYEVEIGYEQDPETGLMYETAEVVLNRPTLKQNGWSFVARVDEIVNEHGENSFITSSLAGENVSGNYDLKELRCDHCGQKRHRSKTYILRDENGQYKQVGSNCMQPFLGLTPSFWALDPEYVHSTVHRNPGDLHNRAYAVYKTERIVALGLALSNNGKSYSGRNSDGLSTKEKLMDYFFHPKQRVKTLDETEYLEQARTILKETEFNGDQDYAVNMRTLVKQDVVSIRHWGYALSAIPVYMKQTGAYAQREKRVPHKGFVGEVGQKVQDLPARIITKREFETDGYGYRALPVMKTMLVMETQDGKIVKWVTSSGSESVAKSEEGDFVNIKTAKIKGHGSYNDDDQTLVINAKLEIV